ncbi:MATE family efflux transporter [Brevirhabdus sp.]|uniref:MATE family efflux transporter n=1 Tax=Brevirhabdus sp. TaxID=2004514 RepID=UPI004059208F
MADTAPAPLSHRRVLSIALPIVLSNATVPILGLVDTGVVGQLGMPAPIGAVGIGAVILTAIYWIFGFLRMGTVGLTSQAIGAGDGREVSALLSRALLIAALGGLALIALQGPLFLGGFALSPASPEVEALARQYMALRIWSAPAAIAMYGITGWLIAQERTRAVLVIQVVMNGINIGLDLLFVLHLDLGVQGVAAATLIAEWGGLALGLWFCRDAFARRAWRDAARIFDAVRLRRMAAVSSDILIRSVLLEAVIVSFLFFGADFGDVTLAANQILLQFLHVTSFGLDGFAFAAETLVGQALGARDRAALRRSAQLASLWGAVVSVLLALSFVLFGGLIVDLMTTAPEVRQAARGYLYWMALAPLVGLAPYMLDGIFIGATQTRDMRDMMVLSAAVYGALIWPLTATLGNHGLWAGLLIFFAARGITLGLRYPALEARTEGR